MKPILVHVPEAHVKLLDLLVKQGKYPNRNEAIRFAIRDLVLGETYRMRLRKEVFGGSS